MKVIKDHTMDIEFHNSIFGILNSTSFWWLVTIALVAVLTFILNRRGRTPYL